MSASANLKAAKRNQKNEFYTQLLDISNEIASYKDHFKDKVVYCNCDDPTISNFFSYFSQQFEHLGLKKLITTCYKNNVYDMFSKNDSERAIWLEYAGDKNKNYVPDAEEIGIKPLKGNGDFQSQECIELLKEADIVVTNPPFSLFREYMAQLVEYDKKFLIIGNINAVAYKEIFPLIQENKVWLGHSIKSGDREFGVPDYYPLDAAGTRIDENGKKYIRVKGVRWFTNLDHPKLHEELILTEKYSPEKHKKYDNYDAINVNFTKEIPKNWGGSWGFQLHF